MAKRVGADKIAKEAVEAALDKITPLAGPYWKVKKLKPEGYHANHIPPKSVVDENPGAATSIGMPGEHHKATMSYGSSARARAHRAEQRKLVREGKIDEAIKMDVDDIKGRHGDIYDETFKIMINYKKSRKIKP